MKQLNVRVTFVIVYAAVSIATFYHSMWGFATLSGIIPSSPWLAAAWWFVGGLMAIAVDAGMGAIVYALVSGWRARWLTVALIVLAFASAYTQIIYAAHHAASFPLGTVPGWLEWLQYLLDARIVLLPLMLPGFALVYAFASKADQANPLEGELQKARDSLSELARQLKERDDQLSEAATQLARLATEKDELETAASVAEQQLASSVDSLQLEVTRLQSELRAVKSSRLPDDKLQVFSDDPATRMKAMKSIWPAIPNNVIADIEGVSPSTVSRKLNGTNGNGAA